MTQNVMEKSMKRDNCTHKQKKERMARKIVIFLSLFSILLIPLSLLNPVRAASENAGSIVISGSPSAPNVVCSLQNIYTLDVGKTGVTVEIRVQYSISCPGSADDGNCDICFGDGSDSDSRHTGDSDSGYLTINKFMVPGESFSVRLHAKYTDWWGGTILGEDTQTALGSTNIYPTPDFSYSPSIPTTDDSVQFTDNSTDPDGKIMAWNWDFGDGSTSYNQNPTHHYTNPGPYTITLRVTDDSGASDQKQITFVVKQKPVASFTYTTDGPTVSLVDHSTDADGHIVSWLWQFGDGTTSNVQHPTHTYHSNVGATYSITLTVTDNDGFSKSLTKTVVTDYSITVTSPIEGTKWVKGDTQPITWESRNFGDFVSIQLYENDNKVRPIAEKVPNTGSYPWPIPLDLTSSKKYQIRVTCATDEDTYDASNGYFTIVTSLQITITSPASDTWEQSATKTITWTYDDPGGYVSIVLYKDGNQQSTIADRVENTGHYNWTVPDNLGTGTYEIKIISTDDNTISNDALITITKPLLKILWENILWIVAGIFIVILLIIFIFRMFVKKQSVEVSEWLKDAIENSTRK
jgi:PKD repeat protein